MIEQHASLSEKFLKKWFWLYLFSFIIAPMSYIIKIIISGELSVEEVWILYGIISLITLLSSYNDLGMSESLKYFIPKFIDENRYDKVKTIIFFALFVQILTSLLIASFFIFGWSFIAEHYFKSPQATEALQMLAFFFIGINIFQTINQFFYAIQNTFFSKISDFIRMVFTLTSVLFIYFWNASSLLNYSISWVVWLYIWLCCSLSLFYLFYYKKYLQNSSLLIKKDILWEISKYAFVVFIWASSGTILSQIDMQMIIYFLWSTDAWYYTNYLSIIWIPFMLIWPIFILLFPVFSEMNAKKQHSQIKITKQLFVRSFIIIGLMFNIFFFVFSEIIAFSLFGEKFILSWEILKYSILFLLFNFLLQINFNIMAGVWKIKERLRIILIAICFNFIMNLILINSIWVYGAALATWFGWVLIWSLSEYYLGKQYFIRYDLVSLFKNTALLGGLWVFMFYYGLPLFHSLSRIQSFFLLWWLFTLWGFFFIFINYKEFRFFIGEIKKLRK